MWVILAMTPAAGRAALPIPTGVLCVVVCPDNGMTASVCNL